MKTYPVVTNLKNTAMKHPAITLSCMATGLILAFAFIYITPPMYKSVAVISNPKTGSSTTIETPFSNNKTISTEILTSVEFVTDAITGTVDPVTCYVTQDYRTRVTTYSFPYSIKHRIINKKFSGQQYTIHELNSNCYQLTSEIHGIKRTKNGKFDEELIVDDLALVLSKKKSTPYLSESIIQPAIFSFQIQSPETFASAWLSEKNSVTVNESNGIITLACSHEHPLTAQKITAALSGRFVGAKTDGNTNSPITGIDKQLSELSLQLEATEAQIAEYKKHNHITDVGFETTKSLDMMKSIQLQKSQLELNLAALNNTSNYLRKNREINNSNVDYGTIGDPVFSEQIALLNSRYALKANGAATTSTDSEIEILKTIIAERILNTRKKTTIQINRLNREIALVQSQLATMPEKANTLNTLDRKLALDKKVYDLLAEQRAQLLVTGMAIPTATKVVKPASSPVNTTAPIIWMILSLGLIGGFIVSLPLNLLAEKRTNSRLTDRESVQNQSRIPFIGSISQNNGEQKEFETSIAALCTRVLLRQDTKFITFASTSKGEGKTFIATHFAQAFAAMDKKVLVIDMNSTNPNVAEHFHVTPERTLADVLNGTCDIHDAICITTYPNLDVLEGGILNSGVNSFLASNKRSVILEDLKKHYDLIVTDTPDIGTQIDAMPLMKMSDLNLFVVNANTSRKLSLVTAEQAKKDYELEHLFLLLNSVKHHNNQTLTGQRRSRVRNFNKSDNHTTKKAYVPELLRKIALWFY
ncbi:MAG: AAA family ATPase [Bacteroidota bacterium]|nr:AAA family ATPase [Bacteroidota bacterium]